MRESRTSGSGAGRGGDSLVYPTGFVPISFPSLCAPSAPLFRKFVAGMAPGAQRGFDLTTSRLFMV
jgi:hypothetical protein